MTHQFISEYSEISKCRVCGNNDLVSITNLGNQYLTGVFPSSQNDSLSTAPLELVKCNRNDENHCCGLVQLKHSYDLSTLYGDNYGYRSGLNITMVDHLHNKVRKIIKSVDLKKDDVVIDIGSNDSTLLQGYPVNSGLTLLGIDPTGKKFEKYYADHITLIPDFFSAQLFKRYFGSRKAKIITSIAMFYDLEAPLTFMQDIYDILADDGIWVFEQSYIGTMLERTSYDTICHEHLEYYGLLQIKWMTDKIGFKIIDIEFNETNGGSFSITVAKKDSYHHESIHLIKDILNRESEGLLHKLEPYIEFDKRIKAHKEQLKRVVRQITQNKQTILGYGASTKGNVILQYCGLTSKEIPYIAEVNNDKIGCFTPGSKIPIISEEEARNMKPDFFLILPWHFKNFIIKKEKNYLEAGGKLLFPLPNPEIVAK